MTHTNTSPIHSTPEEFQLAIELAAMASVKVFGSPTSAEVARVLMCLFEKEVDFQLIRVDAFRGPKRMPQYLKLQVTFHSFSC